MIRAVQPSAVSRRPERPVCASPSCEKTTRKDKPFCPEHVAEHPYAQGVMDQLARLEGEVARVRKVGTRGVNPLGLMSQEILRELRVHGPRTVVRLARDLGVQGSVISSYVAALTKRGQVRQSHGDRGQVFAHYVSRARCRSLRRAPDVERTRTLTRSFGCGVRASIPGGSPEEECSRVTGVSPQTLLRKLKRYGS